jgi:putative endonuclease
VRTARQQAGDRAESLVIERLRAAGWTALARNVRVGRDEIDLVALDPGPPRCLVILEVRWRRSRAYGLPEETIDWRKRDRLRRAALRLTGDGRLPSGARLPTVPLRLDLVAVEPAGRGSAGTVVVRHYRGAIDDRG